MSEPFLNDRVVLHPGNCLDVLARLGECSIDSVVTDPPYHLVSIVKRFANEKPWDVERNFVARKTDSQGVGPFVRAARGFMGKQWDGGTIAFDPDTWRAVFRVLKPGGHLIAMGGTRTYHRLACAIEDAGFEVRDTLSWNFGSGFPKSHDVGKRLDASKERCTCNANMRDLQCSLDSEDSFSGSTQQDVLASLQCTPNIASQEGQDESPANALRNLREDDLQGSNASAPEQERILQLLVQKQDVCGSSETVRGQRPGQEATGQGIEGADQSSMEGWGDVPPSARQLCERSLCEMPAGFDFDGESGRLCDGASPDNGADHQAAVASNRMRSPPRPSAIEQHTEQLGTVAMQLQPQERGAWPYCERCGKPIVPDGLGTALKPAMELIVLARKPLSESTVAANVLRHGTGAINVDACRVATDWATDANARGWQGGNSRDLGIINFGPSGKDRVAQPSDLGRWPANVAHDGSDEVIAAFPESDGQQGLVRGTEPSECHNGVYSGPRKREGIEYAPRGDTGSAARFFYTAKADADDRLGSKHPTVKPLDLMQWLVRLVTPKGGTVLDPFAGTGTTGEASWREGMSAVLIEAEPEYQVDIRRRMALALAGPDERARESIKAKNLPRDDGPLFAARDAAWTEMWSRPFDFSQEPTS